MAFRPLLAQRAVIPAMVTAAMGTTLLANSRIIDAESPPTDPTLLTASRRKPIYDDLPLNTTAPPIPAPPATPIAEPTTSTPLPSSLSNLISTPSAPPTYRPTPTDRLATEIRSLRLALYRQSCSAEDSVNSALTRALALEHSFTSTVRSLAPPKESNEKLFPGSLYVLVSSMAGSIVTRNRNILLRATVPAAIGVTAAWAILPITMRNVSELAWSYEKRYPVVADMHLRARERVERFVETGRAHAGMSVGMVTEKVGEVRGRVEEWVRQGR
ncbi:hypothetical protein M011DRAFT_434531, partial [Sporormia fimetaria CBS 119925]